MPTSSSTPPQPDPAHPARHSSPFLRLALAAVGLFGVAVAGVAPAAQSPAPSRSVRDGVYTNAQAERGADVYDGTCVACHAARMWGSDWTEKSLWDLYDTISNFMPESNPGTLSDRQVRDVLAYILKKNNLPPGASDLPESPDGLKQIRIEASAP